MVKTMKYSEMDPSAKHFVSNKSLALKFVCGFFVLAALGVASGMFGYFFGFIDGFTKQVENDGIEEPSVLPEPGPNTYYVGVGRADVTGPIVQVNMMGYANPSQIASGLHQRLYSRAFVVSDLNKQNWVAFASVDSGMGSQVVKLEVIKKLKAKYGNRFTEKNVVISGTHSHSGPAGFFQDMLPEVTSLGAINETTQAFIDGIVESINTAYSSMHEGTLSIGSGDVVDGNINRSPSAYLKNPQSERESYDSNTEHEMTMLKIESSNGSGPKGMFTWYPVHGTSMNFSNEFISSDNRGRASARFEKDMRKEDEHITGTERFVGAFASANLGDVSPRTKGPICIDSGLSCDFHMSTCGVPPRVQNCVGFGPGVDMFDSTDIIANKQHTAARVIYNNAKEELIGSVGWVHQYVDMTKQPVTLPDGTNTTTCPPGMGYSFAAGTTDGAGAFDFTQSMTEGTILWDAVRDDVIVKVVCSEAPPAEYYECHKPKPVLLPTGYMDKPYPWHPKIVDIQMLKIGQLIIVAVPGEFTTMAGRRIKEEIRTQAMKTGVKNPTVVLAGLSNVYTHYITTPEEYNAQRYEGASTIFGPHTFEAYFQKYSSLVKDMVVGNQDNVPSGPSPPDLVSEQVELLSPPNPDRVPDGKNFGEAIIDVNATYSAGDEVTVTFYGANPRHNMKIGETYIEVQQYLGLLNMTWKTVAVDTDWETLFKWEDAFAGPSSGVVKNVITAIFDIIAHSFGVEFDYVEAMNVYETGGLALLRSSIIDAQIAKNRKQLVSDLSSGNLLKVKPADKKLSEDLPAVESHVTVTWYIPDDQPSGKYRIVYHGDQMDVENKITPFDGFSSMFEIK